MNPISTFLGFLEHEHTAMSYAYACFIFIIHQLKTSCLLDYSGKKELKNQLVRLWDCSCNPVHALELHWDLMYWTMCQKVVKTYGLAFPEFAKLRYK